MAVYSHAHKDKATGGDTLLAEGEGPRYGSSLPLLEESIVGEGYGMIGQTDTSINDVYLLRGWLTDLSWMGDGGWDGALFFGVEGGIGCCCGDGGGEGVGARVLRASYVEQVGWGVARPLRQKGADGGGPVVGGAVVVGVAFCWVIG